VQQTSAPLHALPVSPHTQWPPRHLFDCAPMHLLPQVPQFSSSACVFTQNECPPTAQH
jgi:hypothetical protein